MANPWDEDVNDNFPPTGRTTSISSKGGHDASEEEEEEDEYAESDMEFDAEGAQIVSDFRRHNLRPEIGEASLPQVNTF